MTEKLEQSPMHVDFPAVRKALNDLQKGLRNLYGKKTPLILIYCSYTRGQA